MFNGYQLQDVNKFINDTIYCLKYFKEMQEGTYRFITKMIKKHGMLIRFSNANLIKIINNARFHKVTLI